MMGVNIQFGSVLIGTLGWLRTRMSPVPVHRTTPDPRPAAFVLVFRTGGPRVDEITEAAQLTVESWADDPEAAEMNCHRARAHLLAMRGEVPGIYRVEEFSGPADLPDPDSHQARYTFTLSVRNRGTGYAP